MKKLSLMAGTAAVLLAGCAGVPHGDPKIAQLAPASLGLDTRSATIAEDWWTAFNDPQLNTLIAAGLAGNPSLESALARVRIAEAQLSAAKADRLPQVSGLANVEEANLGKHFISPEGRWSATAIAAGNLSWNLDLFGRLRAGVDRARANTNAANLDVAAARLMLASSIAQAYVGLAQAEQQIVVADGFVKTRQQALGFVKTRIRDQLSSNFDLETAQTLLAEAEQSRVRALKQRELLIHALAALVGRGADFYPQIRPTSIALDTAPAVPELLPADLLGRRPDLLAAQARIEASVANRRVARAAFYPNVNLGAFVGLASMGLSHFLSGDSVIGGAGPAISLPIFDGGKLRAQYRGATADLDRAVADYNDSVLAAVRDSADAITNVRSADADLATQMRVVGGLRETVRLNGVRTRTGLGSQLDAVESGFRLLAAEQELVGLQADALARRIQLITALGGGFTPTAPVTTAASGASEPRS